jgi:hypothetical protein
MHLYAEMAILGVYPALQYLERRTSNPDIKIQVRLSILRIVFFLHTTKVFAEY